MQTFDEAISVVKQLNESGFQAYLVGGCVRDIIMGLKPHDFDVTTNALPDQIEGVFKRTIPTGKQYGTITVMVGQNGYEVTTYRHDMKYVDGRRPECVNFSDSFEEDAARRDFTMNAMAMDANGLIIDHFGGQQSIKERVIYCVGNAEERFKEDQLRKIRGIRFACQKNFIMDETIIHALKANSDISSVSTERYRDELEKILLSPNASQGLALLATFDMLLDSSNVALSFKAVDISNVNTVSRLTALTIVVDATLEDQLALSKKCINAIKTLREAVESPLPKSEVEARKWIFTYPTVDIDDFASLLEAFKGEECSRQVYSLLSAIDRSSCPLSFSSLAVNGHDLKKEGLKGQAIKETLMMLMDTVLENPESNRTDELLSLVHKMRMTKQ